ncbi:hypothetical protein NC651_009878 [Populus alba x Populus x berolinensis]|nr:hypothetical protein NC651_009878 [Populus alba x Populus x berolinensis]
MYWSCQIFEAKGLVVLLVAKWKGGLIRSAMEKKKLKRPVKASVVCWEAKREVVVKREDYGFVTGCKKGDLGEVERREGRWRGEWWLEMGSDQGRRKSKASGVRLHFLFCQVGGGRLVQFGQPVKARFGGACFSGYLPWFSGVFCPSSLGSNGPHPARPVLWVLALVSRRGWAYIFRYSPWFLSLIVPSLLKPILVGISLDLGLSLSQPGGANIGGYFALIFVLYWSWFVRALFDEYLP